MTGRSAIVVRRYDQSDLPGMIEVWNEVVEDGMAFPQEDSLDLATGSAFFSGQSYCGVVSVGGVVMGLYILHPNNVGRCSHIANASFAVSSACRGQGIGRSLVEDCLSKCAELGFEGLQFNAVVDGNHGARRLYESMGFTHLAVVPRGFRMKDGSYEDIHLYFRSTRSESLQSV